MNTAGLSTDQAPPIAVPFSFFALAPVALVCAGLAIALEGPSLFLTSWLPRTIALVHVGTLGVLLAVMLGALYQMVPVVIGTPVPAIRLSFVVFGALAAGVVAWVVGLWFARPALVTAATFLLGGALLLFLLPVLVALLRARSGETLLGMRVALFCLALLGGLGLRLAWGHGGHTMPDGRATLLVAHVILALVGWVGGLMAAVSWQVVPMFYITEAFPPRRAQAIAWTLLVSMLAVFVSALVGAPVTWVVLAALPGALAIFVVQPLSLARLILSRRRRRRDPTLTFWWIALCCAPLVLLSGLVTWRFEWAPSTMLFGWIAIFGWAGATVHGMLTRIVPFLVWFHRFAALAGIADVPPMKRLLPDEQVRVGLVLHALTLLVGALALSIGGEVPVRATGVLLAATGVIVGAAGISVLRRARMPG